MCWTPRLARAATNCEGLSFTYGIIGSILAITGISLLTSVSIASKRFKGEGALGSISLATFSSSVVIVNATVQGILANMSLSRVTRLDLVIIWILQSLLESIWRHLRVKPSSASELG